MKSVSNNAKAVFAVALALVLAVVLGGIALSDNPVKGFFKQQEALHTAKMHMSQVKSGKVYTGALRFADDIDFEHLALSQVIPTYGIRQNGEVFRYENDAYAIYSNDKVVALFGIYKDAIYSGTSMSNIGLEVVQGMLEDPGTCVRILSYGYSGEIYATPNSEEVVRLLDPGPSFLDGSPPPLPTPEVMPMESVGITPEMISQIDFPEHQNPVPLSV